MTLEIRNAIPADAARVAEIYNSGIRARIATFETRERSTTDILEWFSTPQFPFLVAVQDEAVLGWIRASSYRARAGYVGIAEYSVYVAPEATGQRVGDALMTTFLPALEAAGFWKVLSRLFPENGASRTLCQRHDFREVGMYERHAKLEGVWKDTVIVERLLNPRLEDKFFVARVIWLWGLSPSGRPYGYIVRAVQNAVLASRIENSRRRLNHFLWGCVPLPEPSHPQTGRCIQPIPSFLENLQDSVF